MERQVLDYKHIIMINMIKKYHYKYILKYTNAKT